MDAVYKIFYFTVLFLIGQVKPTDLPVGKCKLDDSTCLGSAFQKALPWFMTGVPELGISVLDPLEMDFISFDLSGLQFTLEDGVMKGLRNTVIDKVKWDTRKKVIEINYHLNGTVRGHYNASGRILILPINGDGQMKLRLRNLAVKMFLPYKLATLADGKEHVVPTKYEFSFQVKDNAHFNLSNLFNGNKDLSDAMHTFLNDNWQQVSEEFGRPMMEGAAKKIFKAVITFFDKMPLGEIAEI